jgi:deazaflavin-dependent oxidoreductase (nitroreductase family)
MWYNPIITFLLRSPLHRLVGKGMLLMTYTGRKSGKPHTLPVNYVQEGNLLLATSFRERTWWRNLRGGAPVTVHLAGKDARGIGEAVEDAQAVREGLLVYLRKVPQYARYFGVTLGPDGQPNPEDIARAADSRVMVRVQLA